MATLLERVWYPAEAETPARRALLAPLALLSSGFRAGVAARGWLYDQGVLATHRVKGARVISVGNLNVGGAGKTPTTILLANRLLARGERVAVLSRGYGRRSTDEVAILPGAPEPEVAVAGDEPLLLARRCPAAIVLVGRDRARLAERAVTEHQATVLILDDGLQHRRLARDVDIVVIDAAARFGNGHLMPRGPLREPLAALARATLAAIRVPAGQPAPRLELPIPSVVTRFAPSALRNPEGRRVVLNALFGQEVFPLTAIARPASFLRTLEQAGFSTAAGHSFPDHHLFTPGELERARTEAGARPIVTTEKDRLRLPASFPAWTLEMELALEEGDALLDTVLMPPT